MPFLRNKKQNLIKISTKNNCFTAKAPFMWVAGRMAVHDVTKSAINCIEGISHYHWRIISNYHINA